MKVFHIVLSIFLFINLCSTVYLFSELQNEKSGSRLAVVDSQLIIQGMSETIEARIKSGELPKDLKPDEMKNIGSRETTRFLNIFKRYGKSGTLVIDKKYLFGYGCLDDITPAVMKEVGYKMPSGKSVLGISGC